MTTTRLEEAKQRWGKAQVVRQVPRLAVVVHLAPRATSRVAEQVRDISQFKLDRSLHLEA